MFKIRKNGFVNILITFILITFIIPPQIINPILIGLLLCIVFVRQIVSKNNLHKENLNRVSLFFVLYFLVLLISLIYTENLDKGVGIISASISFLIIPLIPLFISKKEIDLNFITRSYICFLCFVFFFLFFIAIYRNVCEGYTLEYIYDRLGGEKLEKGKYGFLNYWYFVYDKFSSPLNIQPIYLGLFANVGLVFLLYLKKIEKVRFYNFQLIILSLLILLAASRSQILIFIINYFIFIIFYDKSKPLRKVFVLVSLGAMVLIISIINPVTRTRLKESFDYKEAFYKDDFGGTSIRLKKWISATKSIASSPIFGYGVGDGKQVLLNQYKKDKFYLAYYNKYNAHNQYLDTLLYVGFLGLAILLLIFFYAYKYAKNKIYLLLITNIFVIGFFTESMLNRQWGVVSFSFFLIMFSTFEFTKNDN